MSYEAEGIEILMELGLQKIRRPLHQPMYMNYDFDAEKDGIEYSVEIKTTEEARGRFSVPLDELSEMARQLTNKRMGLLLFVDKSKTPMNYYLFQMKRIGYETFDYNEEGKAMRPLRTRAK